MKLLSIAIPCFNSSAYMKNCIESLLPAGDDVEILVIDDGSKDDTFSIAQSYEQQYPHIVRAIHQENAGHGGAVNKGLSLATGMYFKVVDSDDRVDVPSLHAIIKLLRDFSNSKQPVDLILSNYVYDKVGVKNKHVMRLRSFPSERILHWEDTAYLKPAEYIMMHSVIFRTKLLHDCGLKLPEKTFYVDSLYVSIPMQYVKTLYYCNLNFYYYFIGRDDQSINEKVMISRIDQQLRVNLAMASQIHVENLQSPKQQDLILRHVEVITVISNTLLMLMKSDKSEAMRLALWDDINRLNPWLYHKLRKRWMGRVLHFPPFLRRATTLSIYYFSKKFIGFN